MGARQHFFRGIYWLSMTDLLANLRVRVKIELALSAFSELPFVISPSWLKIICMFRGSRMLSLCRSLSFVIVGAMACFAVRGSDSGTFPRFHLQTSSGDSVDPFSSDNAK